MIKPMGQLELARQKAAPLAERLKSLACIECVRGWLNENDTESDPLKDINQCAELGLISSQLQDRLISEVKTIQSGS